MIKILIFLLFMVIGTTLIMCSAEQKPEITTDKELQEEMETVVADTAKAMCPGCGMVMEKTQMISYKVDGETQYYCSEMCKENYLSKKTNKNNYE